MRHCGPTTERIIPMARTYTERAALAHVELVERQLIELEKTLKWFREHGSEARDALRSTINLPDVGYVGSLLNMMSTSEGHYQAWLANTTRKYTNFKRSRR
jgi:hypothetical protein